MAHVVAAFLALACTGADTEPTLQPTDVPAPSRSIRSEAGETPETAPTATVEAAEPSAPTRQQAEAVAVNEPAPAASDTASCRLVQGEAGQPGEMGLHVEVVFDGLEIPWGLAILPSGDLLVTECPGRVRLVQDGEMVPEPVLEFGVSMPPPL